MGAPAVLAALLQGNPWWAMSSTFAPRKVSEEYYATLLKEIEELRQDVAEEQCKYLERWRTQLQTRSFLPGAANLAAYIGLMNKGPFVLEAMDVLTGVLNRMEAHQHKKMPKFRALHW